MAVGTEEVSPLALASKISCPLPVDACPPVPVKVAVAFTTEPVAFRKIDHIPVVESQFVTTFCIVAVETPPQSFGMMKFDLAVFLLQFPLFPVHFHGGMTIATGEYSLCKGWWGNGKFLPGATRKVCKPESG